MLKCWQIKTLVRFQVLRDSEGCEAEDRKVASCKYPLEHSNMIRSRHQ